MGSSAFPYTALTRSKGWRGSGKPKRHHALVDRRKGLDSQSVLRQAGVREKKVSQSPKGALCGSSEHDMLVWLQRT